MIQRQRQIVAVPWRIRPRLRRSIANIRSLPSGSRRALLAAEELEVMKAGGKTIEVVRVRITEAGRKAIEG
jgi:hypothetical protein